MKQTIKNDYADSSLSDKEAATKAYFNTREYLSKYGDANQKLKGSKPKPSQPKPKPSQLKPKPTPVNTILPVKPSQPKPKPTPVNTVKPIQPKPTQPKAPAVSKPKVATASWQTANRKQYIGKLDKWAEGIALNYVGTWVDKPASKKEWGDMMKQVAKNTSNKSLSDGQVFWANTALTKAYEKKWPKSPMKFGNVPLF